MGRLLRNTTPISTEAADTTTRDRLSNNAASCPLWGIARISAYPKPSRDTWARTMIAFNATPARPTASVEYKRAATVQPVTVLKSD